MDSQRTDTPVHTDIISSCLHPFRKPENNSTMQRDADSNPTHLFHGFVLFETVLLNINVIGKPKSLTDHFRQLLFTN